jgi:O-antigen/teichoic acid export membrane protein
MSVYDEAREAAINTERGMRNLFIARLVRMIIAFSGMAVIARALGSNEYGVYSIAILVTTPFSLLADPGIGTALTRFISNAKSRDEKNIAEEYFASGFSLLIISGLIFSLLLFLLSNTISVQILNRPNMDVYLQLISVTILLEVLYNGLQSTILGLNLSKYMIFFIPFRSVLNNLISIRLVYTGYGVFGALLGTVISESLMVTLSFIIIIRKIPFKINFIKYNRIKEILLFGTPLILTTIVGVATDRFYDFVIVLFFNNSVYGNYSIAMSIAGLFSIFSFPVQTILLPLFSNRVFGTNSNIGKKMFLYSIKYTSTVILPIVFGAILFSKPFINLVLGETYPLAHLYFNAYVFRFVFVAIGSWSVGNFFRGVGDTVTVLKYGSLDLLTIPLAYVMTLYFGAVGLIVSAYILSPIVYLYTLRILKNKYGIIFDWKSSLKIISIALISYATSFFLIELMPVNDFLQILLGGTLFLLIYLFMIVKTRLIVKRDLMNVRSIVEGDPFIWTLLRVPYNILYGIIKN